MNKAYMEYLTKEYDYYWYEKYKDIAKADMENDTFNFSDIPEVKENNKKMQELLNAGGIK